jgi:DNA (cytosine-5)-methyltransferase 1
VNLIAIQPLGRNRDIHRLWIESQRLNRLGFTPGTPLAIRSQSGQLTLKPAILGENHVSSRLVPGGRRPIIDLASQSLLAGLADYSEVKIVASFERIQVSPSHRAFASQRSRTLAPRFRVLEVFAGGGTLTAALTGNLTYQLVAGIEIEPDFADEWQAQHPDATLVQADMRALHTSELPEFDVLIGGIPCTCHSNLGRAKKRLAGQPELGDTGDLFLPVVTLVSERMPAAVVFENVPAFGSSLAGELLGSHLQRLGYHVAIETLRPNEEWGELEDRQRWLLVGTLAKPFTLQVPGERCSTPASVMLDAPNPAQDRGDAERIAKTIAGLRAHNARHRAAGHGFAFTEIAGDDQRIPTLAKSYHKINTGPFVRTPFGPRLLRQAEIERLHGHRLLTQHYATAVQMSGQGVQARVFRSVFQQLADHLVGGNTDEVRGLSGNGIAVCSTPYCQLEGTLTTARFA